MRTITFASLFVLIIASSTIYSTSVLSNYLTQNIPLKVLAAYDQAEPAAVGKSMSRCLSQGGKVYKISWWTGYVAADIYFSEIGEHLGTNKESDVGNGTIEFDEHQLSECIEIMSYSK